MARKSEPLPTAFVDGLLAPRFVADGAGAYAVNLNGDVVEAILVAGKVRLHVLAKKDGRAARIRRLAVQGAPQ